MHRFLANHLPLNRLECLKEPVCFSVVPSFLDGPSAAKDKQSHHSKPNSTYRWPYLTDRHPVHPRRWYMSWRTDRSFDQSLHRSIIPSAHRPNAPSPIAPARKSGSEPQTRENNRTYCQSSALSCRALSPLCVRLSSPIGSTVKRFETVYNDLLKDS